MHARTHTQTNEQIFKIVMSQQTCTNCQHNLAHTPTFVSFSALAKKIHFFRVEFEINFVGYNKINSITMCVHFCVNFTSCQWYNNDDINSLLNSGKIVKCNKWLGANACLYACVCAHPLGDIFGDCFSYIYIYCTLLSINFITGCTCTFTCNSKFVFFFYRVN